MKPWIQIACASLVVYGAMTQPERRVNAPQSSIPVCLDVEDGTVAREAARVNDDCKCKVVNKVYDTGGDCECDAGGGQGMVQALSIGEPTYPDGDFKDGACAAGNCPQADAKNCTYKPIRVTFTLTACARSCTGHPPADPGVEWKREYVPPAAFPVVGSNGTVPFGTTWVITSVPPLGTNAECGDGPFQEKILFKKKDGQTAFTIYFEYGCGDCPTATGG